MFYVTSLTLNKVQWIAGTKSYWSWNTGWFYSQRLCEFNLECVKKSETNMLMMKGEP